MDTYREHSGDFDLPAADENSAAHVAAQIGTDERRMHVRAYNYWVSLLDGRDFPSIEDLDPGQVDDFARHSVLLDFTCGRDNPALPYVGAALRDECALDDDVRTIADVPSRSLLSRLTDHFMQIIANRAPVGFEAEFENPRGLALCYRGILMPFSSDGDTIDFIYGVINWKQVSADDEALSPEVHPPLSSTSSNADQPLAPMVDEAPLELTDIFDPQMSAVAPGFASSEQPLELHVPYVAEQPYDQTSAQTDKLNNGAYVHVAWEDGPLADATNLPVLALDEDAGLADRLWAARETAETVKAGEGRTRSALYEALSLAYDFAVSAEQNAEDYAELLDESGMKAQARAPMTPIVKLVFGIDYDKARLTEFAAALSFARRQELAIGGFKTLIESQPGGLKALVAAERQARRPEQQAMSKTDVARARLRAAPSISLDDIPSDEEFAVIVTRRNAAGAHEIVAHVADEALVERVIRRAA